MKKLVGGETYVQSCGLRAGELDDLMVTVMREVGVDMTDHQSRTLDDVGDGSFDIVVAFTDAAGEAARAFFDGNSTEIEVWPLPDPTHGSLDVRAMLNNYRAVRDNIHSRLKRRFES